MIAALFRKGAKPSFLVSLGLHFVLFAWLSYESKLFEKQKSEAPVEISFIDANSIPQELLPDIRQQIVEQSEKALNDEVPEDTAYLSRHNQRVAVETKARNHGEFKNSAGGAQNAKATKRSGKKKSPKKARKLAKGKGALPTLADLTPDFDWGESDKSGDGQETLGRNPAAKDVSRSNDYLEDVEETGIQTILNTREFKYYSYFTRIRNQLRQNWEKKIREKVKTMLRQGRSIASTSEDRITKVIIILDSGGILQKVQVIERSGVRDLDEAAVEAFRAAAPFPNPPEGMIEKDGTVKIPWDFVLEA